MTEPTQQQIDAVKAAHPTRSVHRVECVCDMDDPVVFLMTGPNRAEYERFLEDVQRSSEIKGDVEKARALRSVVENAALAQIRWPDREEAKAIFEKFPALSISLAEQLHSSAGASYEVRSKKL